MRPLFVLVLHSLRQRRGFLATLTIVLFAFQIFMIATARALYKSGVFSQLGNFLPQFMDQLTNMAMLSFQGLVSFGYSHPVMELFLIAMAISIGTEPATEIETRFVDLLMARPIPRIASVARCVVVLLIATAGAIAAMLLGSTAGLHLLTPAGVAPPAPRVLASLAANLAMLVLAWGGIALAVGTASKRRATAAAICGFAAFVAFVIDYVGRIWERMKPLAKLSPFHYYSPMALTGGSRLSPSDLAVLAAIFVAGCAVAAVVYARRDL